MQGNPEAKNLYDTINGTLKEIREQERVVTRIKECSSSKRPLTLTEDSAFTAETLYACFLGFQGEDKPVADFIRENLKQHYAGAKVLKAKDWRVLFEKNLLAELKNPLSDSQLRGLLKAIDAEKNDPEKLKERLLAEIHQLGGKAKESLEANKKLMKTLVSAKGDKFPLAENLIKWLEEGKDESAKWDNLKLPDNRAAREKIIRGNRLRLTFEQACAS